MHSLLTRQLKRHYGKEFSLDSLPQESRNLLMDISASYDTLYAQKRSLEQTLDDSSLDLASANRKIVQQNKNLQKLLSETSDENEEMLSLLKQYKSAIDTSLIVSITDLHGKIEYINENFCKISGYSREELVGKSHNVVRHKSNSSEFFKELWDTILAKKVWQGIFANRAKDGSTYYVNATIVPLLNVSGEIVEFMALREDVTKIIEYQNELQAQKNRVSEILDNQESIIVLFDTNDGVIEANRKFYETFHFDSLEDFKSKHHCVCELFTAKENFLEQSSQEMAWFSSILLEPEKVHLALIASRVYSVKIATIVVDKERVLLGTFTDITEIEEARIKSLDAEREKANFLANMSHEIRTPMNAILGFSELLASSNLSKKERRYVDLIHSSSTTLIEIINDILDFSKLESGMTTIEYSKTNPFMEFEETFMVLAQRAKAKDIKYTIVIEPDIEECVEIDSFHIKQILINLIGNAIKFTPNGGSVDVAVSGARKGDKKLLCFSVKDTGIGIAKERQKKIFEPFSQADSSTTRAFGGTGLGLSISSSLATAMQSKLFVESREGEGSRFYFEVAYGSCLAENSLKAHLQDFELYLYALDSKLEEGIKEQLSAYKIEYKILDRYEKSLDDAHSIIITTDESILKEYREAKSIVVSKILTTVEEFPSIIYNELMRLELIKPKSVAPKSDTKLSLNILVAEDYEINRLLIAEILDSYGLEYEFAFNGEEAVKKAKECSYDLIFMDINMPIMNGIEATNIILNELKITTPIVALTANALEGDKERFLAAGMLDYLSKPIDTKRLERLLLKYSKEIDEESLATSQNKKLSSRDINIAAALERAAESMSLAQASVEKIFLSFVGSLQSMDLRLSEGVQRDDFEEIQREAHNLKSGALTLCFEELGALALEIEREARAKNRDYDYSGALVELREHFSALRESQQSHSS